MRFPRVGPKKFAEPVALSSTASADLRLPATAFGSSFDLLALRARRKSESRGPQGANQGVEKRHGRNLRIFLFSTFPQLFLQCVDKAVDVILEGEVEKANETENDAVHAERGQPVGLEVPHQEPHREPGTHAGAEGADERLAADAVAVVA